MSNLPNRDVVVFTEAIQLPADERAAYLKRACGGDAELRTLVEAMLEIHDSVGDFLEQPPGSTPIMAGRKSVSVEKVGDRIGRYKLLQQIGEGGCGIVYVAEQEEPVRRRVALKIIKPGMDTKSVIARFDAEQQALALMDHPSIAKVFDAGATASGRPYFVMELVRGIKITDFCDQNSLMTKERLELFVQVCKAIQHAHQKGIIHRDIKPSNILVTMTSEGVALPVVIDFGIAKAATNQRLTDKTIFTAFEMLIGTPAYMSPEQAAMTNVDVDTRSDIYSLGVLLYELLTGSTPFDAGELLKAGLDEVRRVILEQEPIRPSTRLTKLREEDLTAVAHRRRSEPPTLIRAVRGDLDWIAMKALEKNRARRYETANGLALDVQRFLAGETVLARPPNTLYKFQKTLLRNKFLFFGAGIITMLMVLSLIIISLTLAKEHHARREADAALLQAETDKSAAQTEAAKSQQITLFLEDMLQGVGPSVAHGRDTTMLREILDRTAGRVGTELTNQPAVEGELHGLIGRLYLEIGNYAQAEGMQRAALAINQNLYGAESKETASSLNDLGLVLWQEGKFPEAEAKDLKALAIRRQLFSNKKNRDLAESLSNLAAVDVQEGKNTEAEALIMEALGIREDLFGEESMEAADSLRSLSILLGNEGKWADAEARARQGLAIRRKSLGPDDPLVATSLADLAWIVGAMSGRGNEAESLEVKSLVVRQAVLGPDHPDVARCFYLLGDRIRKDDPDDSYALLTTALAMQRRMLGEDSPATLNTMRSLGVTLEAQGKFAESEKMLREAMALWRERGESNTGDGVYELSSLIHVLIVQKKLDEAEEILNGALSSSFIKQPGSAGLLDTSVDINARLGKWKEAAAAALLFHEYQPLDHDRFAELAALLVKTHNNTAYGKLRKELLTTFASTSNPYIADGVAKGCLFLPASADDLKVIGRLADETVTLGSGDAGAMPFFEICKALSEYRQGDFVEAAQWAQKSVDSSRIEAQSNAYGVLAMAYWQMGQKDHARALLADGEFLAPEIMPASVTEDPGDTWLNWLFARIMLDEAARLIQPGSAGNINPNNP